MHGVDYRAYFALICRVQFHKPHHHVSELVFGHAPASASASAESVRKLAAVIRST
jgi:hypothetical protein